MSRVRVRRNTENTRAVAAEIQGELADTLKAVRKRYGDNVATTASSIVQPNRISTGVFIIDYLTLGGIASNRASMIVGERHAGKSLLSCKIARGAQDRYPDKRVAYVDIEGTFDPVWARKLGVDTDTLLLLQPETGEQAVDLIDAMVGTNEISLVVVDSIAALTPMKEIDSSAEDALVGIQARLVGGMIRKTTASMIRERRRDHEVAILYVNQFRSKIGGFAGFGEPRSIPGGKALEFATSLQLIMKNKENSGKDALGQDSVVVNEHSFTITKNKLNGGGRTGEFRVLRVDNEELGLTEGDVDDAATMLAVAKRYDAYTGKGSSWKLEFWDYEFKFRGLGEAVTYLYENPDVRWDLRNFLIASYAESLGMPQEFIDRFNHE